MTLLLQETSVSFFLNKLQVLLKSYISGFKQLRFPGKATFQIPCL